MPNIVTKPGRIIVSGFGFNLKRNAVINKVSVEYNAWVKNSNGGEENIPNLPGVQIRLNTLSFLTDGRSIPFYGVDRTMTFSGTYK